MTGDVAMESYKLFRMDRQGRRSSEFALCIREHLDVLKLRTGNDNAESLWVRIRGRCGTQPV